MVKGELRGSVTVPDVGLALLHKLVSMSTCSWSASEGGGRERERGREVVEIERGEGRDKGGWWK